MKGTQKKKLGTSPPNAMGHRTAAKQHTNSAAPAATSEAYSSHQASVSSSLVAMRGGGGESKSPSSSSSSSSVSVLLLVSVGLIISVCVLFTFTPSTSTLGGSATAGPGSDSSANSVEALKRIGARGAMVGTATNDEPSPSSTISPSAYYYDCQRRSATALSSSSSSEPQWSHDVWRSRYCEALDERIQQRSATLSTLGGQLTEAPPSATNNSGTAHRVNVGYGKTLLFVDAKEECGRYREFLLTVRESGYAGMIVVLIYYAEDVGPCNELLASVAAFAPLTVHYAANVPRAETTLLVYHGVVSYISANRGALQAYSLAAVVRAENADWCSNPFDDYPRIIAPQQQQQQQQGGAATRGLVYTTWRLDNRRTFPKTRRKGWEAGDEFMMGPIASVYTLMKRTLYYAVAPGRSPSKPSWEYLRTVPDLSRRVAILSRAPLAAASSAAQPLNFHRAFGTRDCVLPNVGHTLPTIFSSSSSAASFEWSSAPITTALVAAGSFTSCGVPISGVGQHRGGVFSRHSYCYDARAVAGGLLEGTSGGGAGKNHSPFVPRYTPFCYMSYRHAISEVDNAANIGTYVFDEDDVNAEAGDSHQTHTSDPNPNSHRRQHRSIDDVWAVPSSPEVTEAIHEIRTAAKGSVNDIYSNPTPQEVRAKIASKEWGGFSNSSSSEGESCPHGKLAILSMMGVYPVAKVIPFITSYLHAADPPLCTRLVAMLKWTADDNGPNVTAPHDPLQWSRGIVKVAGKFADRIEIIYYTEDDGMAADLKRRLGITGGDAAMGSDGTASSPLRTADSIEAFNGRPRFTVIAIDPFYREKVFVDQRFEVGRAWLERNYKRYRYVSNIDSRDIVFLGDPLRQLVKILRENGPVGEARKGTSYINDEFVASVTESYPIGSYSVVNDAISMFAMFWLQTFGPNVFQYLGQQSFTNGEPYAIVNSGHIIGTAVGLLHYYRLHVRMTVESKFKFDTSDQGTFTFYFYMVAPVANYPHRLLGIHSSRSGFANPPHFNRVTRRQLTSDDPALFTASNGPQFEYGVVDCAGNTVVTVHQADRDPNVEEVLQRTVLRNGPSVL